MTTLILAAGIDQEMEYLQKFQFAIGDSDLIQLADRTYGSKNAIIALPKNINWSALCKIKSRVCHVGKTGGALATALIALQDCDLSQPLFICPGDAIVKVEDYESFRIWCDKSDYDACVMVLDSENPDYSYVRVLSDKPVEFTEKKVISSRALTGIYYFRSAELFLQSAEWALINQVRTLGQFFIAPSLNYLIMKECDLGLFTIDVNNFYRFATLAEATESRKRFLHDH